MWLSFTKVRKLAKSYSFLIYEGKSKRLVELKDKSNIESKEEEKNTHLVEQNCSLILIRKELAKLRLAITNGENFKMQEHIDKVNPDDQEMIDEKINEQNFGHIGGKNVSPKEVDPSSSSDSEAENQIQNFDQAHLEMEDEESESDEEMDEE